MKTNPALFLIAVAITLVTLMGCHGGGGQIVLPDISNFKVEATPTFVLGSTDSITVKSTSLIPGGYEVCYNLTGANVSANDTAIFLLDNGKGTFATSVLTNPGITKITITQIINNSSGYSSIFANNTATFTDSTGIMYCTLKSNAYRATDLHATLSGAVLTVMGTVWSPLTKVYFSLGHYTGAAGSTAFNAGDATAGNGWAGYITTDTITAQHGVVTITGISPTLTGTFSFTGTESSAVSSGTFSCPAP